VRFLGAQSQRAIEPQCKRTYRCVAVRRDERDLVTQSIAPAHGAWVVGCLDVIAAPRIATADETACRFDLFGRFRNGNPHVACPDRRDAMDAARRIASRFVLSGGRMDAARRIASRFVRSGGRMDACGERALVARLSIANDHDRDSRQRNDEVTDRANTGPMPIVEHCIAASGRLRPARLVCHNPPRRPRLAINPPKPRRAPDAIGKSVAGAWPQHLSMSGIPYARVANAVACSGSIGTSKWATRNGIEATALYAEHSHRGREKGNLPKPKFFSWIQQSDIWRNPV
jgi:hypothetical protein